MAEVQESVDSNESPGIYVRTLEIQWHLSAPLDQEADRHGFQCRTEGVTSIDFHPSGSRIATTGADSSIMLWYFHANQVISWLKSAVEDMSTCCTWITTMRCAEMPRCARWSPCGLMLASAHSDPRIRIWWKVENDPPQSAAAQDANGSEKWKDMRILTGHLHEVMDVSFSPDSRHIVSAGMLGHVLVHDLEQTAPVMSFEAHTKFCHGVAWDPWNFNVATFGGGPGLVTHSVVSRTENRRLQLVVPKKAQEAFLGEGCSSSMRRLSWSPDGSMLAVPFGKNTASASTESDMKNCIFIYYRGRPERAAMKLSVRGPNEIRGALWAPCVFEPLPDDNSHPERAADKRPWGPPDYRMALATWTEDTVIVFTTDQGTRHSDFSDLHMLGIADVSWSPDGRFLLTCSLDGYVSVLHYAKGGLGVAHRVPTFSSSQTACVLSKVLQALREQAQEYEERRTRILGTQAGKASVTHAAVKKKRRTEHQAATLAPVEVVVTATEEVGLDELEKLIDP